MKCLSPKDVMMVAGEGEARAERYQVHLAACPACRKAVEEARRLEMFFRSNSQPADPSPFLWTRIEARLSEDTRVSGRNALGLTLKRRWLATTAAASLLFIGSLTLLVILQPSIKPSESTLASIDQAYDGVVHSIHSLDENPFAGFHKIGGAGDENPFKPFTGSTIWPPTEANPFRLATRR